MHDEVDSLQNSGTYIDDNELAPMKGETMTVGQEVIFGETFQKLLTVLAKQVSLSVCLTYNCLEAARW